MATICSSCGKEIAWMKAVPGPGKPEPRPNPIEVEAHPHGNLVLDRTRRLYRFATIEELELAAIYGKNLYISHFAVCPEARQFRRK